ncbi:MAG: alpha/beta hydrolase [Candidatus Altiarchaeota archaeon]|nr:alpha/beta hydrolase [Candidatus Altiarchaeota archaeon]
MEKISYGDGEVAYKIVGKGRPVLFIHGMLTDHTTTGKFVNELIRSGFKLILLDLPGHGESTYWNRHVDKVVDSIHEVMKTLKLGKYYGIGHSMGTTLASELARVDSNMEKVVLITPTVSKKHTTKFFIDRFWEGVRDLDISLANLSRKIYIKNWWPEYSKVKIEKRIVEILEQDWRAFASGFLWGRTVDMARNIEELGDRCMVIAGTHDQIAPLKYVKLIAKNLEIVDCNHSSIRGKHLGKGKNNLFVKFFNKTT